MPTLIGFAGRAGSGKDTAASHLCSQYGFTRLALAGPLRQVCSIGDGIRYLADQLDRIMLGMRIPRRDNEDDLPPSMMP